MVMLRPEMSSYREVSGKIECDRWETNLAVVGTIRDVKAGLFACAKNSGCGSGVGGRHFSRLFEVGREAGGSGSTKSVTNSAVIKNLDIKDKQWLNALRDKM